jgi:3-methylfumaryl-CoA hydratase
MTTDPATSTRTEVIAAEPVEALAAMLDIDVPHAPGDPVPPLWHWTYLLDRRRESELGPDGHPTSGIPAPPGPGRRRMFAGPLTFVTVLQEITQDGQLAIREEQDIVYRAPGTGKLPPAPQPPAPPAGPTLSLAVDERMLFRFSALTYNAHRIHYDLGWVAEEGYDGLVIHGPLQALLMGDHQRRQGIDLLGATYGYRLVSPMVGPQTFTVVPGPDGLKHGAESRSATGAVCAVSTLTTAGVDEPGGRPGPSGS